MWRFPADQGSQLDERKLPGSLQVSTGQRRLAEFLDGIAQDVQKFGGGQVLDARLADLVVAESNAQDMTHPVQGMIAAQIRGAGNRIIARARIKIMQSQPDPAIGNA